MAHSFPRHVQDPHPPPLLPAPNPYIPTLFKAQLGFDSLCIYATNETTIKAFLHSIQMF